MGAGGGEEERKPEAEELGAGGELCTLHPPSWLPQARSRGRARPPPRVLSLVLDHDFPCLFLCDLFGAQYLFLGQAWAAGKGELATCGQRTGSPDRKCAATVKKGRTYASMNT